MFNVIKKKSPYYLTCKCEGIGRRCFQETHRISKRDFFNLSLTSTSKNTTNVRKFAAKIPFLFSPTTPKFF